MHSLSTLRIFLFALMCFTLAAASGLAQSQSDEFQLLPAHGAMTEAIHPAPGQPTIICILDAHANPDAQLKIAFILDAFEREENIRLIGVEGASGIIIPDIFKTIPENTYFDRVLENHLKTGVITGVEYYAAKINPDALLYGMENGPLYTANLENYREVSALSTRALDYIVFLEDGAGKLKNAVYTPELCGLIQAKKDFDAEALPLSAFMAKLGSCQKESETRLDDFPQLQLYIESIPLEEKIDLTKINDELKIVMKRLEQKLSKEDLQTFVTATLKYRLGKISETSYHELLETRLTQTGSGLSTFTNLFYFAKYRKLHGQINYNVLFNEVDLAAEREINIRLSTEDQKELYMLEKHLSLLKRAVRLELSRADLLFYQNSRTQLAPETLESQLWRLLANHNVDYPFKPGKENTDAFSKALPHVDHFYENAQKRDAAMLDNILREMRRRRAAKACIVIGGFHKDGLLALSQARGIGCTVVTPTISDPGDPAVYKRAMTGVRLPLTEKLKR